MSGQHKGVAKIITDKAHLALYVHCHALRLNLALVDAVKSVQAAADFFVLMERLYAAPPYQIYLKSLKPRLRYGHLFTGERVWELQKLSDTRWSYRYVACKAVRDRFAAIIYLFADVVSH